MHVGSQTLPAPSWTMFAAQLRVRLCQVLPTLPQVQGRCYWLIIDWTIPPRHRVNYLKLSVILF